VEASPSTSVVKVAWDHVSVKEVQIHNVAVVDRPRRSNCW